MKNTIGSKLNLGIFALVTLAGGLGACGNSSDSGATVAGSASSVGPKGTACPGSSVNSSMTSSDFAGRCQSAYMAWQARESGSYGPTTGPQAGTGLTLVDSSGSLDQKFSKFCSAMKSWKAETNATDSSGRYREIAGKAQGCTARYQTSNLLMAIDETYRSTNEIVTGADPDAEKAQPGDQAIDPTSTVDYK